MLDIISFFFNDTATTEIYTLSLHDALPILPPPPRSPRSSISPVQGDECHRGTRRRRVRKASGTAGRPDPSRHALGVDQVTPLHGGTFQGAAGVETHPVLIRLIDERNGVPVIQREPGAHNGRARH